MPYCCPCLTAFWPLEYGGAPPALNPSIIQFICVAPRCRVVVCFFFFSLLACVGLSLLGVLDGHSSFIYFSWRGVKRTRVALLLITVSFSSWLCISLHCKASYPITSELVYCAGRLKLVHVVLPLPTSYPLSAVHR